MFALTEEGTANSLTCQKLRSEARHKYWVSIGYLHKKTKDIFHSKHCVRCMKEHEGSGEPQTVWKVTDGGTNAAHIPLLNIAFGFAGRTFNNFMSPMRTSSVSDSPYSSERPDSNVEELLSDMVNVAIEKISCCWIFEHKCDVRRASELSIFRLLLKRCHSCIVVGKSQPLELCVLCCCCNEFRFSLFTLHKIFSARFAYDVPSHNRYATGSSRLWVWK